MTTTLEKPPTEKRIHAQTKLCVFDLTASDLMTEKPVCYDHAEPVDALWNVLSKIRHVLVKDQASKLVGLVSHRDILRWSSAFRGKVMPTNIRIDAIMSQFPRTATKALSLRTVAIEMKDNKFGCMPIVDENEKPIGIITESDFVWFFTDLSWQRPEVENNSVRIFSDIKSARNSSAVQQARLCIKKENLKVADVMTREVFTLTKNDVLADLDNLIRRKMIRHVPIVDKDGYLEGIVSQRDYLRFAIPDFSDSQYKDKEILNGNVKINEVLTPNPKTITEDMLLSEAAAILVGHKFGSLPVVSGKKLVGIITESDFVRLFADGF